jgi:hypothetical protein
MNNIKTEISEVISELEKRGVDVNDHLRDKVGLGDVVEDVLKTFGITEERFKQWFGLKECGCSKRKKWLNGLFSWKVNNDSNKTE